jgi:alkanesulfonate monooxygenase SsuD/methylene tetrahydromethanopterin reductase-like flavin-dependent oxidoreductase (luciferase family)
VSKSLVVSLVIIGLTASILFPSIAAEEEIVGPLTRETLYEKYPDWQAVAAAYQPKPACVDALRSFGREVRIEIYLGTWCSDSKAQVSAFFKVLEMADSPLFQTVCTGIPEDKAKRAPFYQGKDIVKLPTFLVYVAGQEVGRIVETPERSVEEDLVRILGL